MTFRELLNRSKSVRVTAVVREGAKSTYYPESFDDKSKQYFGKNALDLRGVTWLTSPVCEDLLDFYVVDIHPTENNYMTVSIVRNYV